MGWVKQKIRIRFFKVLESEMARFIDQSLYIETDAKKGYWPKSRLIIKIHNFEPNIVKLCQNDQLMPEF